MRQKIAVGARGNQGSRRLKCEEESFVEVVDHRGGYGETLIVKTNKKVS